MRIIFFLVILFSSVSVYAETDTVYFNKDWKRCLLTDSALYYRLPLVKLGDSRYQVKDYYLSNNQLQMKGAYTDSVSENKSGPFIYYYEDGKISSAGNYVDNKRTGTWKTYYKSGDLYCEGYFIDGQGNGIWKYYYDSSKILMSTGNYSLGKRNGPWKFYYRSGFLSREGVAVNGNSDGYWKYYYDSTQILKSTRNFSNAMFNGVNMDYYPNGTKKRLEEYNKKGYRKRGMSFTQNGTDTVYFPDRSNPTVAGGNKTYVKYLHRNKIYNDYYYKKKVYGEVVFNVTINEKGELTNMKVIKSVSNEIDSAARQIVSGFTGWLPALDDNGKPITATREANIYFRVRKNELDL